MPFWVGGSFKREIIDLGYDIAEVEDGRVTFYGDEDAICRANIFLRTAERILVKAGSFKAVTFEELFDKTKNLPWERYIPKNGKFWVAKAASVKSKLFSTSDIQSIMKKAMVRTAAGILWNRVVSGRRSFLSGTCIFDERYRDSRNRYIRCVPAQERIP